MILFDYSELHVEKENHFCFSQRSCYQIYSRVLCYMKLYPQLVKICKSDGMDVKWCKMIDNPRMQCCKGSHNHSVKTYVWLLKTYLFFLGGSKILKRKGSVHWNIITFLILFNLVKSPHHKTILQYPLHPIPLLSLTSLSWGIPVYIYMYKHL